MDFEEVQESWNDLPLTFKRPGEPFTQFVDALTAGLTRDTSALDQMLFQVQSVQNARFGWLDIFGLLVGLPRFSNEADQVYLQRILYVVNAGAGTPVGMSYWVWRVWRVLMEVDEVLGPIGIGVVGYSLVFHTVITLQQAIDIVASLARIRPAGVPILSISISAFTTNGLFLDTINFLDLAPSVTGAYFSLSGTGGAVGIPGLYPSTNSAEPLLPDLFLVDPTINPSLAPTG